MARKKVKKEDPVEEIDENNDDVVPQGIKN
jgi:hypothetical protein